MQERYKNRLYLQHLKEYQKYGLFEYCEMVKSLYIILISRADDRYEEENRDNAAVYNRNDVRTAYIFHYGHSRRDDG